METAPLGTKTKTKIRMRACAMCAFAFACAAILPALPTRAQDADSERARVLFEEGVGFSDAEQWEQALERFEASAALADRASSRLNIANALLRLGRAVEAREVLDLYLRRPDVTDNPDRLRDGNALRVAAAGRIAEYTLTVRPEHAVLAVDDQISELRGEVRALALDPGAHVLELSASGHQTRREEINAVEGPRELLLQLEPSVSAAIIEVPAQPDSEEPGLVESPIFWIAAGAIAILGTVLTIVLLNTEAALDGGNQDTVIPVP